MRLGLAMAWIIFLPACGSSPSLSNLSFPSHETVMFPTMPDASLTPGNVCRTPDEHRYHEGISYCVRNVSLETKNAIIRMYDERLGYAIESMNRQDFKIDHFISLCMGGSNDVTNLWPQHRSVFELTDRLEGYLCDLMAKDDISQVEAINAVQYAKRHLAEAPRIEAQLAGRLGLPAGAQQ